MTGVIDEACAAVDVAAMMAHIEVFARRTKLSGTPEELESFHYIQDRLDEYGLRTDLMLHDAYISLPGQARLAVGGNRPGCITHSFSRPSSPGGCRGTVVYAGHGTPADFAATDAAGKVVLLDGIANPAASLRASQAGAIGQIHISPLPHLYEMCIPPVWGSSDPATLHRLPATVVVSVRRADGDAIKTRVLAGELLEATLHAEVDTRWRPTPLLEARLDGAGVEGEEFVMFSGHHDTWYRGLMDNGGANAVMLEAGRIFAQRRGGLRRGLRLCFWSGHSHGRYSGSAWYADNRFEELDRHCAAHVNIDSVGASGNTVLSDALSSHELFQLAAEAVLERGGQVLDGHRMSRAGDQSFWGIGIPSVFMAMGERPPGPARASWGRPSAVVPRARGPASAGGGTHRTTRSTRSTGPAGPGRAHLRPHARTTADGPGAAAGRRAAGDGAGSRTRPPSRPAGRAVRPVAAGIACRYPEGPGCRAA